MRSPVNMSPSLPQSQPDAPTRIMIVDDRVADARELENTMSLRGYDLTVVHNALNALDIAKQWKPHVAILDVKMPGMDGLVLSANLRKYADDPIVIFVTSDDSLETELRCLAAGDDYITKPYNGEKLLLRIQNKLRRHDVVTQHAQVESVASQPGAGARRPFTPMNERTSDFTPTEARLLSALIAERGGTVSRDKLLRKVWGSEIVVNDNTLDNTVRRLRKKIEPDPRHPRIIITVRQEGYRIDLAELRRIHLHK